MKVPLTVWPLHILTFAVGLFLIVVVVRPRPHLIRIALALLSGLWIFVAVAFVYGRYAQINWAVVYLLPLFAVVAALLAYLSARKRRPLMEHPSDISRVVAIGVLLFAVFGFLLLAIISGRPFWQAEFFGVSP